MRLLSQPFQFVFEGGEGTKVQEGLRRDIPNHDAHWCHLDRVQRHHASGTSVPLGPVRLWDQCIDFPLGAWPSTASELHGMAGSVGPPERSGKCQPSAYRPCQGWHGSSEYEESSIWEKPDEEASLVVGGCGESRE